MPEEAAWKQFQDQKNTRLVVLLWVNILYAQCTIDVEVRQSTLLLFRRTLVDQSGKGSLGEYDARVAVTVRENTCCRSIVQ